MNWLLKKPEIIVVRYYLYVAHTAINRTQASNWQCNYYYSKEDFTGMYNLQ